MTRGGRRSVRGGRVAAGNAANAFGGWPPAHGRGPPHRSAPTAGPPPLRVGARARWSGAGGTGFGAVRGGRVSCRVLRESEGALRCDSIRHRAGTLSGAAGTHQRDAPALSSTQGANYVRGTGLVKGFQTGRHTLCGLEPWLGGSGSAGACRRSCGTSGRGPAGSGRGSPSGCGSGGPRSGSRGRRSWGGTRPAALRIAAR